jgi:hypothetical protein
MDGHFFPSHITLVTIHNDRNIFPLLFERNFVFSYLMTQLKFCAVLEHFIDPLNKSIKQSDISFH